MVDFILTDGTRIYKDSTEFKDARTEFVNLWMNDFRKADDKCPCPHKPNHHATIVINVGEDSRFGFSLKDACCEQFAASLKKNVPLAFPAS